MKINIEINNNEHPLKQIEAIKKYIESNLVEGGFNETGKDTGHKVYHSKGVNHVMCNKTKKGNYSFKVWLAV